MKAVVSLIEGNRNNERSLCKPKPKTSLGDHAHRLVSPVRGSEIALNRDALGVQLAVELYGCATPRLDDIVWVKRTLVEAAKRANATIVGTVFHKFNPVGVSGVVVIQQSHLAIHIWPEHRYAAVDVFSCGTTLKAANAAKFLVRQFRSARPVMVEMRRGLVLQNEYRQASQIHSA